MCAPNYSQDNSLGVDGSIKDVTNTKMFRVFNCVPQNAAAQMSQNTSKILRWKPEFQFTTLSKLTYLAEMSNNPNVP